MKNFSFILCVFIFAFCQMGTASNKEVQMCSQAETLVNEPYIRIGEYFPGITTLYAYVENKPAGTNFKWFIDGEGWQCIYQYPDDEGAAFEYMGSEEIASQPNWIWLEYIDAQGVPQRIFYELLF